MVWCPSSFGPVVSSAWAALYNRREQREASPIRIGFFVHSSSFSSFSYESSLEWNLPLIKTQLTILFVLPLSWAFERGKKGGKLRVMTGKPLFPWSLFRSHTKLRVSKPYFQESTSIESIELLICVSSFKEYPKKENTIDKKASKPTASLYLC